MALREVEDKTVLYVKVLFYEMAGDVLTMYSLSTKNKANKIKIG
jgi:hypothetical protein